MSHRPDAKRASNAYSALLNQGTVPSGLLAANIEASWKRSQQFGLECRASQELDPLTGLRLADVRDRNLVLMRHARPVMETLYEQIVDTQSMVVLTDASGLILDSLGGDDFLPRAEKVALRPGVVWSEQSKGTNAIGTAIAEQKSTLVHGPEHFLSANHFLTCSAVPLLDPHGETVGVLDVTGDWRGYHRHTMALARMSGQLIENHLFASAFPHALTIHFHTRAEFVGTLCEGMVAFDLEGKAVAANASGLFQLGISRTELLTKSLTALFGTAVGSLMRHSRLHGGELLTMTMHTGVRVNARIVIGSAIKEGSSHYLPKDEQTGRRATDVELTSADKHLAANYPANLPAPSPRRKPVAAGEYLGIQSLRTGDATMEMALTRISKVLGRDICIMIQGETGTGKELVARAIHNDSPRRSGAFVALNCAAIPEGLIESELFGYEEGAFTGARKKGRTGKIQQADGGTLFLDEIGDMPLNLQARLLRVLQERVVTPLGGVGGQPVDVAIVCATHRRLKDLIASGGFREDLYYRLNGMLINLPPLRARTDIEAVVARILRDDIQADPQIAVGHDVLELFRRHPWPGNIRQLCNLLRTAVAMCDDKRICVEHLPDDFFEDLGVAVARPPVVASNIPLADCQVGPETDPEAADVAPVDGQMAELQMMAIRRALAEASGNVSDAARKLGISRNTIYRKLRPGPSNGNPI
jgi:transcriptional regulator of acetoin/glycerol metabolism